MTAAHAADSTYVVITGDTHAGAPIDTYREYLDPHWRDEFDAWRGAYKNPSKKHIGGKKSKNWDSAERLADHPTRRNPPTRGRLAPLPTRPGSVGPTTPHPAVVGRSPRPQPAPRLATPMNLSFIEYQPRKVLEAFRRGEFDGLEVIGQADERDFFERCFLERLLSRLAESMPTQRKKQEVPRWFILAANLSLKLHQENSFLAFERVVRCGGLLSALPPDLATKHLDPKTRQWALKCQGFNDKNDYDRKTPCDQDTLRKALKDVPAAKWLNWFNGPVQQVFQTDGFFDPQGLFVGDASYLFVPDNPAYEGSEVLWFDEHNHPVDDEKLTAEERRHVHRRRCYKWVSLLHLRGGAFVYAAVALLPSNAHETFTDKGGKGSISVTTSTGCAWTATKSVDWVGFTSGTSMTGSGTVTYSVSPNASTTSRTTSINITRNGQLLGGGIRLRHREGQAALISCNDR